MTNNFPVVTKNEPPLITDESLVRLKQSLSQPVPVAVSVTNQSLIRQITPQNSRSIASRQFIGVLGIVSTLVAWMPLLSVSIIGGEPTSLAQWLGMGLTGLATLCFGIWMTLCVNRAVDQVLPTTGSSDYRWKITLHGDNVKATLMYIEGTPGKQWNFRVEAHSSVRYLYTEAFNTIEACESFIARANAEVLSEHQLQLTHERPAIDTDVQEQLLSHYQRGLDQQLLPTATMQQLPTSSQL